MGAVTRTTPTVSVLIPAYNYGHFVAQAIDSALGQTRLPLEVIVVDDGSTDDTPRVLAAYVDRIRILRRHNGGVSRALNVAARQSRGDVLAFLDADDRWLPAKLERQVERLVADSNLGLVHCGVEEIDGSGNFLRSRLDGIEGDAAEALLMMRAGILGGGSAAIVPRGVFEEVGGFDPEISVSQDWDLFFRIASRHRIGFVAEALVQYRLHGGNQHLKVRRMEADMLRAFEKAFSVPNTRFAKLRRRAYGALHAMLAGSLFHGGYYRSFAAHAARSLALTPEHSGRLLGFPLRALRRRTFTPHR